MASRTDLYETLGVSRSAKQTEVGARGRCGALRGRAGLPPRPRLAFATRRRDGSAAPACRVRKPRAVPGPSPRLSRRGRSCVSRPADLLPPAPPSSPRSPVPRAQIRRAYRNLLTSAHPDKGGDPAKFHAIQRAYDVLINEAKRAQYDADGVVERTVDEEFLER